MFTLLLLTLDFILIKTYLRFYFNKNLPYYKMGVEKFFSSLKKGFTNLPQFIHIFSKKISCNHLLIDFNSIVHIISQFLLKNISKNDNMNKDIFEKQLIEDVGKYIETLITDYLISSKIKSISICVDGVPTMSKIMEQKKRRYMGDIISYLNKKNNSSRESNFSWSRNNISPGTDFMIDMMKYLNSNIFKSIIDSHCENLENYIVSGIDVEGEGEFKIIKIIETIPKGEDIIVYSPDSDMIILLFQVNRSVNMLRYDQQESTYDRPIYNIIEIDKFKNIFIHYIDNIIKSDPSLFGKFKMNENNIIADMVFILSVFGDDFLPKLETLRVNMDINILIDFYVINTFRNGYILNTHKNIYSVNTSSFLKYLTMINEKEYYFIERNAKLHVISNYHKIEKNLLGDTLYKMRELIVCYLWKFIYLNKSTHAIKPINCSKYINLEQFIQYIQNKEVYVDSKILNHFTKKKNK